MYRAANTVGSLFQLKYPGMVGSCLILVSSSRGRIATYAATCTCSLSAEARAPCLRQEIELVNKKRTITTIILGRIIVSCQRNNCKVDDHWSLTSQSIYQYISTCKERPEN